MTKLLFKVCRNAWEASLFLKKAFAELLSIHASFECRHFGKVSVWGDLPVNLFHLSKICESFLYCLFYYLFCSLVYIHSALFSLSYWIQDSTPSNTPMWIRVFWMHPTEICKHWWRNLGTFICKDEYFTIGWWYSMCSMWNWQWQIAREPTNLLS